MDIRSKIVRISPGTEILVHTPTQRAVIEDNVVHRAACSTKQIDRINIERIFVASVVTGSKAHSPDDDIMCLDTQRPVGNCDPSTRRSLPGDSEIGVSNNDCTVQKNCSCHPEDNRSRTCSQTRTSKTP